MQKMEERERARATIERREKGRKDFCAIGGPKGEQERERERMGREGKRVGVKEEQKRDESRWSPDESKRQLTYPALQLFLLLDPLSFWSSTSLNFSSCPLSLSGYSFFLSLCISISSPSRLTSSLGLMSMSSSPSSQEWNPGQHQVLILHESLVFRPSRFLPGFWNASRH